MLSLRFDINKVRITEFGVGRDVDGGQTFGYAAGRCECEKCAGRDGPGDVGCDAQGRGRSQKI